MQLRAGIGAQADGVARVGRNLGADEDDVEHGQEKVSGSKRAGKGASRTAPVRNCRRFLRGGRPRPGRCAQPGSYPCLCGTRAAAYPGRSRPAPGVRATASTVTLSAPAANSAARRPRPCCPWSSRRPPAPRAGRARPAHEIRQPGRRGARAGPAACRGVSRRRSSAPCRRGRSSASARLRAISMAGFMPRRRSEARLAGTAASTASAGRGAARATAAPSRRASTSASDRRSRVFN